MSSASILPEPIQAARIVLVYNRPYLASVVWAMIPVVRNTESGLNTMGVDQWGRWYINVEEVIKWPVGKIALAIVHEINHLLRRHHDRMATFSDWYIAGDMALSNIAGDLEINDGLKDDAHAFHVELPKDWLYPNRYGFPDGLLAEEYADKLIKRAQQQNRAFVTYTPDSQGQQGQQNQQGKQGQQQDQKSNAGGSKDGKPTCGSGQCGSCSGSGQQPWEEGPPPGTPGSEGGKSTVPGISAPEMDIIRRQVAHSIRNHSNSRGDIPAGWQRWANTELQPPKIPWTKELAAVIRRSKAEIAGMVDYSWKRLSRRSTDEILLPGLRKPKIEAVGVLDTSGSMSDDDTGRSLREFAGVLKVVGLDGMRFLSVDAAVHAAKRVWKPSQVTLYGGGGTDMRIGIEAALELKPPPDLVIVFTDGETPWPDNPPPGGERVIAVLVRNGPQPPSWIRTLRVD